jgi:ubiquinone/menaquinone biosynthesis C-methylase UbiE
MIHNDHVHLIQKAISPGKQVWADLGCGWGAFTLALRDVGGNEIEIYAIDQDTNALEELEHNFKERFADSTIHILKGDFAKLDLPLLDGILMANSLHYIEDQLNFLSNIKSYLKPNGKLVLVEYSTDQPNTWIPYPLSFNTFKEIAAKAGFSNIKQLHYKKLDWIDMYSAEAINSYVD